MKFSRTGKSILESQIQNSKLKTIYRTKYTFIVLSDEPLDKGMSFAEVLEETDSGSYLGWVPGSDHSDAVSVIELRGKAAADACYEVGSDPGFFDMDDEGLVDNNE